MLSYDVGANLLFDDRIEELIIHDPRVVDFRPPRKYPDRIFGLKKTKTVANLLDADRGIGNLTLRCSPFRDLNDPLLFPFLIIEAKPERHSIGFEETQMQTALPIWALLNLQESVRIECSSAADSSPSLVWFIANRGDAWRVYGCYVT